MKLLNKSDFLNYVNLSFILKIIIFFSVINILLFEFRFIMKELDLSPKTKIYLKGAISNPESLYQASLELENKGKFEDSILDMKLAITLLESGNYSSITKSRYADRLKFLVEKSKSEKSKN